MQNKVKLWKIEKYGNREKFLNEEYKLHLQEVIENEDYESLCRILKYSNILLKKENEIEEIKNIIPKNFLENKKIKDFFNELDKLQKIYIKIQNKKKEYKSKISIYGIFNYVNKKLKKNEEEKNKTLSEVEKNKYLNMNDFYIIILGRLLKNEIKKNKNKLDNLNLNVSCSNLNEIEEYINVLCDEYNFDNMTDIWKYSDLEIEGEYFIEKGEFGKNRLITHIPYLKKRDKIFKEAKNYKEAIKKLTKNYSLVNEFNPNNLDKMIQEREEIFVSIRKKTYDDRCKKEKIVFNSLEEIKKILPKNNIEKKNINNILKNEYIFSEKSQDLYDSPIIKLGGKYIIFPFIFLQSDFSRSFISIISQKEDSVIAKKGKNFEEKFQMLLEEKGIIFVKNEKLIESKEENDKKREEIYEIDIIYKNDDTIIFLELKTQRQPENYQEYQKYYENTQEKIEKFKRNINFFISSEKGIDFLEESFGNYSTYKKIFISDVVFPENEIDDILLVSEDDFLESISNGIYSFDGIYQTKIKKLEEIKSEIRREKILFLNNYINIKGYELYIY